MKEPLKTDVLAEVSPTGELEAIRQQETREIRKATAELKAKELLGGAIQTSAKNRSAQRMEMRQRILDWYLQESGGVAPECQCEDAKPNGTVIWWLDPLIPGVDNPVMVERFIGDAWVVEIQKRKDSVRVFIP